MPTITVSVKDHKGRSQSVSIDAADEAAAEKLANEIIADLNARKPEGAKFPQIVYLHPKNKAQEHRSKPVKNADELKQALAEGWREQPHIPVAEGDFEADIPAAQ